MRIPEEIYTEIHTDVLARWWCTLNSWSWPNDLPGKPPFWDKMEKFFFDGHPDRGVVTTKYDVVKVIMVAITDRIGEKECLRYHHMVNLGSTSIDFEIWYQTKGASVMFTRFKLF